MALKVWLPLNGNLNNQGLGNYKFNISSSYTLDNNGKIGQCYKYLNSSFTNLNGLKSYPMTISFWMKTGDASSGWQKILMLDNTSLSQIHGIYVADSARVKYEYNPSLNANNVVPTAWHHYVFTIDDKNSKVYYDGVLSQSSTETVTLEEIGRIRLGEGTNIYLNDVRIYDECLSQKQIKEISKGLIAHYKLDNPYIETTSNLAPGINGTTSYSTNTSPAWDTELNGTPMINPSGWGNGYNGGVTDPTHGYHAHWIRENGQWMMIFPNLNSVINQKGRWLGISSGVSTKDILAGEKYTISWWQKTDNLNLAAWGGIYYKKTSDGTMNFWDSCPTLGYNTKLNTWQFMYKTFTRSSEYVQHDGGQSVYVYGGNSNEGTMYVKDVQIVRGDHPLPYAVGTRNGQSYESDCSGNRYNATKFGTLTFNTDTPRYSGCNIFDANTSYFKLPVLTTSGFANSFTIIYWAKITDMNGKMAWGFGDGNRLNIYPSSSVFCCNTGDGSNNQYKNNGTAVAFAPYNNAWHQYAMVGDGTTNKLYIDGVYAGTATTYKGITGSQLYISGWDTGTNYKWTGGSISDFRIYATALSADDILTMYKNSGIIDNKGNVYAYEFKEE